MLTDDALARGSAGELFAMYRSILRELGRRGIVRTENAPAGDYAEFLVATALGGSLAPNSEKRTMRSSSYSGTMTTPCDRRSEFRSR